MGSPFASGKRSLAVCDICGFEFRLPQLRKLMVAGTLTETKACPACWTPDQPQLMLGRYPVSDPQAVRDPRPDTTYVTSGLNVAGNPSGGSRMVQWGWQPVGGGWYFGPGSPENDLAPYGEVGDVTVTS
jgi:hypothetical protein